MGFATTNSLNFFVNLDKESRVVVPLSKDDMFSESLLPLPMRASEERNNLLFSKG